MRNLLKIALVANIFEWYEFTIYAYLANIIGQIFFDAGSSVSGIIKVFSIFAIGIMRRAIKCSPMQKSGALDSALHTLKRSLFKTVPITSFLTVFSLTLTI